MQPENVFPIPWELSVIIYIYFVKHPIDKNEYKELLLSYDIVHLVKSILFSYPQ